MKSLQRTEGTLLDMIKELKARIYNLEDNLKSTNRSLQVY